MLPSTSCKRNRPTRVPASIVVRMNKRLEHDREVIPKRQRGRAGGNAREHVRHADRKRRRAAGAAEHGLLAEICGQFLHRLFRHRKSGRAETFATTSVGVPFTLIAKYSPGCSTHAAIIAINATIISVTIAP